MKVVSLFLLLLLFASTALAFIFDVENEKVSIWKGEIDTSWYNDSQTEFTITTAEQLAGLAKLVNEGYDFKGITVNLGANINLKKKDWTPIGAKFYKPFKGTFNGKGFVVSGLHIDSDVNIHGLFGRNSGMIRNLGIIDSYVSGNRYIGGLAGINMDNGVIDNCYFSGTVGNGSGLVGANSGIIINSYSTGKVISSHKESAGGLVGDNGGKIINSYSTSTVVGSHSVGGLVSYNDGRIINSYSIGAVEGKKNVGGLVGFNNKGSIINSYSIGTVKGIENVGGFVGGINVKINAYVTNAYYDKQTSGQIDSDEGKGKTTAEMKQKSTYIGWDFDKTWGIDSKVNGGYPYLQKYDYGVEYVISTAEELIDFAKAVDGGNNFLFKTVKLGANIMLNDTVDWQKWEYKTPKNNWRTIGRKQIGGGKYISFNGTFDGNGFVIGGVYVNHYNSEQGLFEHIGSAGIIKNLGIVASHIEGKHNLGGFAGINEGEISNCYYIGSVLGYGEIGGLVGNNMGIIKKSYSIGSSVSKSEVSDNVGGLVGRNNEGVISDSYSHSKATGRNYVGGLVGHSNGIIKNSYSTGKVRGTEHIGGFIGGSVSNNSNNYYDMQTSGQKDKDKSEGKTTAEMKQKSTYIGWDFDRTWGIDGTVNGGYPYLLKAK